MRIESFSGDSTEMDSAFNYICSHHYKNLIVDIRDNSGGATEAGMAFARHLFKDTVYGGIFLTQKYFNERATPPMVSDYNSFPSFTTASFSLFIKGINEQKGISLKVVPFPPVYTGNLYLLVNENTTSTCEPIAYAIKQYKRGILVGHRTAGAMMTGEHFAIKDGFELTIPTAIYYTADGKKLDKNGVQPDIETKDDALTVTLKHIK
jgi:C-terminal processing protease CtpA/Prc